MNCDLSQTECQYMKRTLKYFWASSNSTSSGVGSSKKGYNFPESEEDDSGNDSNEEIEREIRRLNDQDG